MTFLSLLQREILIQIREKDGLILIAAFFVLTLGMFAFSFGEHTALFFPKIVWVITLFASLLVAPRLFTEEERTGIVDSLRVSQYPLEGFVLAKALVHWGVLVLGLTIVGGLYCGLTSASLPFLRWSLVFTEGSLSISFLATLGAALTVTHQRAILIMGVVLFPLYIPVLIWGEASLVSASLQPLLFLASLSFMTIPISIYGAAFILRQDF